MKFSMFKDMLDSVEQLGKGIQALKDLPPKDRDRYRRVIGETYSLLDSALTMVINRLGDVTYVDDDDEFSREVRALDNVTEWTQLERDVRLCSNLRATGREMRTLWERLKGRITLKNQGDFDQLVYQCLEQGEGELADFINASLGRLATAETQAAPSGIKDLRTEVQQVREALQAERRDLMERELSFYKSI